MVLRLGGLEITKSYLSSITYLMWIDHQKSALEFQQILSSYSKV